MRVYLDLHNLSNGFEMSQHEEKILKSSHLKSKLVENNYDSYKYLMIPVSIYNLIEVSPWFNMSMSSLKDISGPFFVGTFYNFECYVDMYLDPNTIIMKYNTVEYRDKKIDTILNDIDFVNEIVFDVVY